jgi:hypothetical protein
LWKFLWGQELPHNRALLPHWYLKRCPATSKRIGTKQVRQTPKEQEDEMRGLSHKGSAREDY